MIPRDCKQSLVARDGFREFLNQHTSLRKAKAGLLFRRASHLSCLFQVRLSRDVRTSAATSFLLHLGFRRLRLGWVWSLGLSCRSDCCLFINQVECLKTLRSRHRARVFSCDGLTEHILENFFAFFSRPVVFWVSRSRICGCARSRSEDAAQTVGLYVHP